MSLSSSSLASVFKGHGFIKMTSKNKVYEGWLPLHFEMSANLYVPFCLFFVFISVIIVAIYLNGSGSWAFNDMQNFHIPQINTFIEHPFNVFNYSSSSATTPGFHILLAWLIRILGYQVVDQHVWPLRIANLVISCLPVAVTFAGAWRLSGDAARAAALVAALAGSSYVIGSAAYVTTDNGALGFFALIIFLLNFHPNSRAWLAAAFAGLVAWRQIYLPVAGAIGLSIIRNQSLTRILNIRNVLNATLIIAPGLLLLGVWALHWGGLVPPEFRTVNAAGFRPAVLLQALAMTGLLGFLFLPLNYRLIHAFEKRLLLSILGISFILSASGWILTPTDFDMDAGRWGSLIWLISAHSPLIAKHSIAVLILTWIGMASLFCALAHAHAKNYFPAEALCLLFYFLGYSMQVLAWQRYVEPQILIFFAFFTSRLPSKNTLPYVLPAGFGVLMTILTIYK